MPPASRCSCQAYSLLSNCLAEVGGGHGDGFPEAGESNKHGNICNKRSISLPFCLGIYPASMWMQWEFGYFHKQPVRCHQQHQKTEDRSVLVFEQYTPVYIPQYLWSKAGNHPENLQPYVCLWAKHVCFVFLQCSFREVPFICHWCHLIREPRLQSSKTCASKSECTIMCLWVIRCYKS